MKNTMDFYNKTIEQWAEKYNTETDVPSLYEFLKTVPVGSRVLDLCCGCGYETQRIKNSGFDAIGIDFSEKSIDLARKHNPDITFYVDNILNDYSYIESADIIVIIAGLVHIQNDDLRLAFKRMYDVLSNNGYVFICTFEGSGKINKKSYSVIDNEEYDRCFIGHTLDEIKRSSDGLLSFVKEVGQDGTPWKNYIFRRI